MSRQVPKVAEHDWWFRGEANWKDTKANVIPFEKVKLTFVAESSNDNIITEDFDAAKSSLASLMAMVENPNRPSTGGFTEDGTGIRVRHAIFGVSKSLVMAVIAIKSFVQRRDEVATEVTENAKFHISKWPVNTKDAKDALAAMVDTHYICTPPIYDVSGELVHPRTYIKRFRGAIAVVKFTVTSYKWDDKNVFCIDLAHLRVLVNPSPGTPTTPRYKRKPVLDRDTEFVFDQPDFKKAKTLRHTDGTPVVVCV